MSGSTLSAPHPTIANLKPVINDDSGYIIFGHCTGTPDTTASVFQHGCILIQTDTSTGSKAIWENVGSVAVPSWNLIGSIVASEITLAQGSILVGNSSGVAQADQTIKSNVDIARTLTSQTTENTTITDALTTDSTFLTGTNVSYSGGRGSSVDKITGIWSATSGGFHGLYSGITASGAFNDANGGVVNIKGVNTTSSAMTASAGIYGGQFISRHNHATNKAANACPYIGIEGVVTQSTAGQIGTAIGVSAAYHIPADAAVFDGGAVWRGLQVTCDNSSSNNPSEQSGVVVWNMAGTQDNAYSIVTSGSGFTTGLNLNGTLTNGVKVTGATQLGVSVTMAALTAGDAYTGVKSVVTSAAPSNAYGLAGYFEGDISGVQAGTFVYGNGSWINGTATYNASAGYLAAQDNGLYIDNSATLTGAKLIFGLRMESLIGNANAGITHGEYVFPFSLNTQNNGITALFECMTATDLGTITNAGSDAGTLVPLFRDAGGNLRYVKLYTAA